MLVIITFIGFKRTFYNIRSHNTPLLISKGWGIAPPPTPGVLKRSQTLGLKGLTSNFLFFIKIFFGAKHFSNTNFLGPIVYVPKIVLNLNFEWGTSSSACIFLNPMHNWDCDKTIALWQNEFLPFTLFLYTSVSARGRVPYAVI